MGFGPVAAHHLNGDAGRPDPGDTGQVEDTATSTGWAWHKQAGQGRRAGDEDADANANH